MSTQPETADFILDSLGNAGVFTVRRMFGEFCLYAYGKPVAFICDDTLFVKILPASAALASICEQGPAYPGSKDYYVIEESQHNSPELAGILTAIADTLPNKAKSKSKL